MVLQGQSGVRHHPVDYYSFIFAWAKRILKKVKERPRERERVFSKKLTVMSFFSIR